MANSQIYGMRREQWFAVNNTSTAISLGIYDVPAIKPKGRIDILQYVNKFDASNSQDLLVFIKSGAIVINKYLDGVLTNIITNSNATTGLSIPETINVATVSTVTSPVMILHADGTKTGYSDIPTALSASANSTNAVFNVPFTGSGGSGTFNIIWDGESTANPDTGIDITYSSNVTTLLANINAAALAWQLPQPFVATGTTLSNIQFTATGNYCARPVSLPTFLLDDGDTGFTIGPATIATVGVAGGDTICVFSDQVVSSNIAKNGVNYYVADRVKITNNSNSAGYLFDDLGQSIKYGIFGNGHFNKTITSGDDTIIGAAGINSLGDFGIINQTNLYSFSTLNFDLIDVSIPDGATPFCISYEGLCQCAGGAMYLNGREILISPNQIGAGLFALWWNNGQMIVNVHNIDARSLYLSQPTNYLYGDFYIKAHNLVGEGLSSGYDALSALWIDCLTYRSIAGTQVQGGKFYLNCEKYYGALIGGAQNNPITTTTVPTECHITCDKWGDATDGSGGLNAPAYITFGTSNVGTGTNFTAWLTIKKFAPETATGFIDATDGATVYLDGLDFSNFTGVDGITSSGTGTVVNIQSGIITTSSGHFDLVATSNGIINVGAGVGFDASKTSISSGGAINIIGAGSSLPAIQRVKTNQARTSNTTLSTVTGLSFNVVAGKTYNFIAELYVQPSTAGGHKYAIGGTCTATNIVYNITSVGDSLTALDITSLQTTLAGSAGATGATSAYVTINGTITVNAAGTLTVQFAQNASNGTGSTVLAGSIFQLIQIS